MLGKWGYEVITTDDGTAAWQALQRPDAPQLAILDWMMPGMDGLQVCREVRQLAREPYVYILLLTARSQKEDIIAGMEAGADDYLTKPFDVHELQVRLRAGQRILGLQAQLIAAREAQREQATHDALTGALNRGAIIERLRQELARAQREDAPVGIVMADLDHFKWINDTHGHLAGDMVLREAVQRMRNEIRPHDVLGRYGGEEFLLILPGCSAPEAVKVAERLRTCLAEETLVMADVQIPVTGSFGVTTAERGIGGDVDALLRAADTALYRAKQSGRNRVVLNGNGDEMVVICSETAEICL
jgi:diguanylate cyclase (GGDEF)-like protein